VKNANPVVKESNWRETVSRYAGPDVRYSLWQLFSTLFLLGSAVRWAEHRLADLPGARDHGGFLVAICQKRS